MHGKEEKHYFEQVLMPDGSFGYTRNGEFRKDKDWD